MALPGVGSKALRNAGKRFRHAVPVQQKRSRGAYGAAQPVGPGKGQKRGPRRADGLLYAGLAESAWRRPCRHHQPGHERSEEHTSELQSLMRISYAVFCLKKKKDIDNNDRLTESILDSNK